MVPHKVKMQGKVPLATNQAHTLPQEQPPKEETPIPTPTNVDDFFNLESFIEEENQMDREKWTVTREAKERRELEELEEAKVGSLCLEKEEKKRCKAKMHTNHLNENASTSSKSSMVVATPLPTKTTQSIENDQPSALPIETTNT